MKNINEVRQFITPIHEVVMQRSSTFNQVVTSVNLALTDIHMHDIVSCRITNDKELSGMVTIESLTDKQKHLVMSKVVDSIFKELITFDASSMFHSERIINKLLHETDYFKILRETTNVAKLNKLLMSIDYVKINSNDTYEIYRSYYAKLWKETQEYIRLFESEVITSDVKSSLIALSNICYIESDTRFKSKRLIELNIINDKEVTINIHEIKLNIKSFN